MASLLTPKPRSILRVRMSLYKSAKCNLSDGGGPWQMCLFSDRPWLAFVPIEDEGAPYEPNIPEVFAKGQGIEMGEQFPWSSANQLIVWEPSLYDNVVRAWDGLGLNQKVSRYGT